MRPALLLGILLVAVPLVSCQQEDIGELLEEAKTDLPGTNIEEKNLSAANNTQGK